ncbi:unnamed protein product [Dicrocoelium dendriticum]|nr:unnamed protein product [Dicrocoelium dendriticum]
MSVIIRLQNLPMSANASNIRRFFSGLAIPEGGVHIVGGNDGDAFIAFATDEDARKAMLLDRQTINGASVRLFLSSKTEMQSIIDSARNSALLAGAAAAPQPAPQKTETMQALDVSTPTLPSSFSSYRNGVRETYPSEHQDQYSYGDRNDSSSAAHPTRPPFEAHPVEGYANDPNRRLAPRPSERAPPQPESASRDHDYEFERQPPPQYSRFDGFRDRPPPVIDDFRPSTREPINFENRASPKPYREYYGEPAYDRRPPEGSYPPHPKEGPKDVLPSHVESRYGHDSADHSAGYEDGRFSNPHFDRFSPREPTRETRDFSEVGGTRHPPPYDRRSSGPHSYERDIPFHRPPSERDFSIRPPWLNEESGTAGPKRPYHSAPDVEEYPRKRRPFPPRANDAISSGETEYVVKVTLPISEVGIKVIFEVLRGVHIVPKWGIRVEEDALLRPTGYIFIMTTSHDSYNKALNYDGRPYRGKPVKVAPSSLSEFYRVTDSSFHHKCPPEILKKLPSADQPACPPHHSDGCLEVAELPPDTTRSEIVRFIGAPGLTASSVVISGFSPSDRTAPKTPGSVRALVSLPSAKDLDILLSAKPRPLRPDGAFPPVRLTPISRLQLEAYGSLSVENKPKEEPVKPAESAPLTPEAPKTSSEPLTCAHLTGLERSMKDSEVLRLFPSVLVPGDAVRMVGPENTSAYIDFISENNCRRAIADIRNADSKAKLSHPNICIEAISRREMESHASSSNKDDEVSQSTSIDPRPSRSTHDRDPRDTVRTWESRPPPRAGRHASPGPPFRTRSPSAQALGRSKFDEPYYDRNGPAPSYDDRHGGPMRRGRPMDIPHTGPPLPPPVDYALPPRPSDSMPPHRRQGLDFVTVHIGNLPSSVTVEQLCGIMRDYYFVPGSIRLRRDIQGIPTGEALVDFNSTYDGDRAIRDLNGYRLAGRPIHLQYDRRP